MSEHLARIYYRTDGHCHICGKKLSLVNFARFGWKGAWERDHSNAWANGGTDGFGNLYAACISCNRRKGTASSRTARRWHGRRRAPLSRVAKQEIKTENSVGLAAIGGLVGGRLWGPWGMVFLTAAGYLLGRSIDPDD